MMKTLSKVFSSALFRLIVIVMAVVIPLNLLTLVLGSTVIAEVERQISLETENALQLYVNQMDDAMRRINTTMYLLAREDVDFTRLNVKEVVDQEEYYRQMQSVVNLGITLNEELEDNTLIDGAFAYFMEKDHFIVQGGTSQQMKAIREMVRTSIAALPPEDYQGWRYTEVGGEAFLIFISVYRQACYGAWISLEELAWTMGLSETEGVQAFTDTTGRILYSNQSELEQLNMDASYSRYDGRSYTLAKAESRYSELCLVQVLTKSELTDSMPVAIRVLQVLSVVAIVIIPLILFAMQRWIGRPVAQLVSAMEKIEQGHVDYRIPKSKVGSEFDRINSHFNHMMDEVSELKINMYEQQLKTEKIRLGFLSRQIQPHFIINALNILYSYEPEEYHLGQKMILCLSKYFRYVVNANADFVELGQELEHIRNYFEIQQARFLRTFHATVVYDQELADCLIPPLIVQNFTENAIKHSLVPGKVVSIVVEARRLDEERIHICVYDTGAGIPQSVLDRVEEFRANREFRMDLGVGIQNSIDRLDIIYGDRAALEISRIEPQGTRIDIVIPMKRREPDADERDFG